MRFFIYTLFLFAYFSTILSANSQNYIVLTAEESSYSANAIVQEIQNNEAMEKLKLKENFDVKVSTKENYYILNVGPFQQNDTLTLAFIELKKVYPSAFILEKNQKSHRAKLPLVPLEKIVYVEQEDPTLWTALFGLALIGILALFLSSDQIKNIKLKHAKLQARQKETEEKQNFILSKMGEKIQSKVLNNIQNERKILETGLMECKESVDIRHRLEAIEKSDGELLNTIYEIIDFLKIKSGNIFIHSEPFQLSAILHKLTNSVSKLLKDNNALYYDVKADIPRYLVGDSLRIYQILHNVLSYTLEDKNAKRSRIVLSIETRSNNKLVFKIVNVGQYLNQERMDSLFIPNSWEEIQHTNKKFSFFVTNELASQMDGLFEIHSDIEHGTSYELILPYIEDEEQKSNKEQLEKILPDTKALIVYDDNMFNMEILKNNLESFGVSIDHQTTHHLKSHKFDMGHWDIAIISTQDITPLYLEFFQRLREKRGTKVVLLHEIYESEDLVDVALQITDAEIYSPVIPGDIEETLLTILSDKKKMKQRSSREEHFLDSYNQKGIINIVESPNVSREDFRKFSGNHILVAEDNFVNQKVIGSILSASGIHVHKAENGVRAIEILKEHKIDLVLMDMSMPVMDGFTATRKIKEDPDLTGIPIVAVSALGFKHEIERMEQVGVDACVVKPFKIGQIFIALDKYLSVIETSVVEHDAIDYSPDKDILDVEQGILNTHNKVFYKEILREVRSLLGNSEVHFVQMVLGMEEKELKVFCRDTLSLVETIGATQLTKILREILVFLSGKKRVSLERYVPLYRKEWKLLNAEIEKYIKR